MNEHGCVPVKVFIKTGGGQNCSRGHNLQTWDLNNCKVYTNYILFYFFPISLIFEYTAYFPHKMLSFARNMRSIWRKRGISKSLNFSSLCQVQFSSVSQSCPTLQAHGLQHARLPSPSPTPRARSNSGSSSWWCHPTVSSSAIPFSSCLQTFPASGSFPMSQFFTTGGQFFGASASSSVLPMNIQDWFPLGWTGWISLQFKGLSRVFSNTMVQKHQFFGTQPSLWFDSYIHTWLLEKP